MSTTPDLIELSSNPDCKMDWTLGLTQRALKVRWEWRRWRKQKKHLFQNLHPEFETQDPSGAFFKFVFTGLTGLFIWLALENQGREQIICGVLAGICGLGMALNIFRQRSHRTLIKNRDGSYALMIAHKDFDPEALHPFLEELQSRIQSASASPDRT
ncbi:hypothetical protein P3T73_08685 [Kiritimatiellota bacterium B12222]|nr:hypothetical protein P3T73_08685 [Kiritimatiellota bacterium B12222]